jgi:hypothetical protein
LFYFNINEEDPSLAIYLGMFIVCGVLFLGAYKFFEEKVHKFPYG